MTSTKFYDDLPPIARSRKREPKYSEFAAAAIEHPGKWAVLDSNLASSTVKSITDGAWSEFTPAGEFEAASRNGDKSGKGEIWVRYVGPSQQTAEEEGVDLAPVPA